MSDFFKDFSDVSKAEWEAKLIADLKGKDPSILKTSDLIEEFEFASHVHKDELKSSPEVPGSFPFTRGLNSPNNDWRNGGMIIINNEKEANKEALEALNLGADQLIFDEAKSEVNWDIVLKDIQLEFIEAHFRIKNIESFSFVQNIQNTSKGIVDIQIDFL